MANNFSYALWQKIIEGIKALPADRPNNVLTLSRQTKVQPATIRRYLPILKLILESDIKVRIEDHTIIKQTTKEA